MANNITFDGLHLDNGDAMSPIQERLCERCQRLQFSPDSFYIRARTTLQPRGEAVSRVRPAPFQLKSGGHRSDFATIDELCATSEVCIFCGLLYQAICRYSSPRPIDKSVSCSLTWEVDGRKLAAEGSSPSTINITRRLRFRWASSELGPEDEVYIVFLAPSSDPSQPATPNWQRNYQSFGREDDPPERQALIKGWLDACCRHHKGGCTDAYGTEHEFLRLVDQTYFGVIDVDNMRLTSLPLDDNGDPEAFVALSYVWGSQPGSGVANYATIRANIINRIEDQGLMGSWSGLPPTIQDSILLVRKLGYQYLWVDALCIVQDSHSSWTLNAGAMHLVYGNAEFTICAADGDSFTGLRAARPIVRSSSERSGAMDSGAGATNSDQNTTADAPTLNAEILPGVRLLVTRPLETVVNESPWSTRAWTFQERLLSRRCLIFAEGRFYFQCRTTALSQDIHTDGAGSSWELGQTNSLLRTLMELRDRPMWFYLQCIRMYTGRQLTKQEDIINAFKGALWLLKHHMSTDIVFGLPTSHFDLALLWQPSSRVNRRGERRCQRDESLCRKNLDGDCTCPLLNNLQRGQDLPTWSWAGWSGGKIEYQQDMLTGCLGNVHDWLTNHTWIQWYIRDGNGSLVPLWNRLHDSAAKTGHQGVQDGWRGYRRSFEPVYRSRDSGNRPEAIQSNKKSQRANKSPSPNRVSNKEYLTQRLDNRRQETSSTAPAPSVRHGPEELYNRPPPRKVRMNDRHDERETHVRVKEEVSRNAPESHDNRANQPPWSDKYGRRISGEVPHESEFGFRSIIPDHPFGVSRHDTAFVSDEDVEEYMPILQFFTWSVELHVAIHNPDSCAGSAILQCDIVDKNGDWCGWVPVDRALINDRNGRLFRFIAISEAEAFTLEECPVWTYYIPKERSDSKWDLYFVMMIERNDERGLMERTGLGKVFQAAFTEKKWDEIKLG